MFALCFFSGISCRHLISYWLLQVDVKQTVNQKLSIFFQTFKMSKVFTPKYVPLYQKN